MEEMKEMMRKRTAKVMEKEEVARKVVPPQASVKGCGIKIVRLIPERLT